MEVKIQKKHPDAVIPEYKTSGAAGFDFYLVEDVTIPAGSVQLVPTGLAMAIPGGHTLLVISRSSGPIKMGTTMGNGVGVIDSDFSGPDDELFILVENLRGEDIHLQKGQRVAQGLIVPVVQACFVESELTGSSRGGHGSTGGHGKA